MKLRSSAARGFPLLALASFGLLLSLAACGERGRSSAPPDALGSLTGLWTTGPSAAPILLALTQTPDSKLVGTIAVGSRSFPIREGGLVAPDSLWIAGDEGADRWDMIFRFGGRVVSTDSLSGQMKTWFSGAALPRPEPRPIGFRRAG